MLPLQSCNSMKVGILTEYAGKEFAWSVSFLKVPRTPQKEHRLYRSKPLHDPHAWKEYYFQCNIILTIWGGCERVFSWCQPEALVSHSYKHRQKGVKDQNKIRTIVSVVIITRFLAFLSFFFQFVICFNFKLVQIVLPIY